MTTNLDLSPKAIAKIDIPIASGHRLCAGCAAGTIVRQVMMALRGPTIFVNATGCLEVATTIYPYTAWKVPWIHVAFENAAAVASGIEGAIKAMRRKGIIEDEHVDIITFGGDGGTFDIGIQALSGALERGHDFVYIVYDNYAYQNTGIQRSGATLMGQSTTTSWAGTKIPGKIQWKKPFAEIMAAHRIPYVATASPYYWQDLVKKVRKALEVEGPAVIHVVSSCTRGWRFPPELSIELTKVAVETLIHPLYEVYDGKEYHITKMIKKPKPVTEFFKLQGQFKHLLTPEWSHITKQFQERVIEDYRLLLKKAGIELPEGEPKIEE